MERVVKRAFKLDEGILKYLRYDRRELERQNDFAEGKAKGREEGRIEGCQAGQRDLIKTFYQNGMSVEELHKMSGLDMKKIESILNVEEE